MSRTNLVDLDIEDRELKRLQDEIPKGCSRTELQLMSDQAYAQLSIARSMLATIKRAILLGVER